MYQAISGFLGGMAALITFICGMVYACQEWGWLIGLAFGWIPSVLAAAFVGILTAALWPIAALLLGVVYLLQ